MRAASNAGTHVRVRMPYHYAVTSEYGVVQVAASRSRHWPAYRQVLCQPAQQSVSFKGNELNDFNPKIISIKYYALEKEAGGKTTRQCLLESYILVGKGQLRGGGGGDGGHVCVW